MLSVILRARSYCSILHVLGYTYFRKVHKRVCNGRKFATVEWKVKQDVRSPQRKNAIRSALWLAQSQHSKMKEQCILWNPDTRWQLERNDLGGCTTGRTSPVVVRLEVTRFIWSGLICFRRVSLCRNVAGRKWHSQHEGAPIPSRLWSEIPFQDKYWKGSWVARP
jgi:hypothetical protein